MIRYREIYQRRRDLLVEMFVLIKRKENLSSVTPLDEEDDEFQEFMNERDILQECERYNFVCSYHSF